MSRCSSSPRSTPAPSTCADAEGPPPSLADGSTRGRGVRDLTRPTRGSSSTSVVALATGSGAGCAMGGGAWIGAWTKKSAETGFSGFHVVASVGDASSGAQAGASTARHAKAHLESQRAVRSVISWGRMVAGPPRWGDGFGDRLPAGVSDRRPGPGAFSQARSRWRQIWKFLPLPHLPSAWARRLGQRRPHGPRRQCELLSAAALRRAKHGSNFRNSAQWHGQIATEQDDPQARHTPTVESCVAELRLRCRAGRKIKATTKR